jgi:uncharacterized phage protein (TIGR01671 family)
MREIKFRAWHKTEKKMYRVLSLVFGQREQTATLVRHEGPYVTCHLDEIELMQYIGFMDKNGKEVYEGDILQEIFMDKPLEWPLWQVVFKDAAFVIYALEPANEEDPFLIFLDDGKLAELTVFGNIYENPELMKDQPT